MRHTTEIRESYQASVDAEQRERAANTQSAGTTLESLRRKKDDGVTEKRVIYPPGGLTHVSIKDPEASSTVPAAGTMATDLAAAASSGTRTAWMEAEPAGLRLIGNPVRMGGYLVRSRLRVRLLLLLPVSHQYAIMTLLK